MTSQELSQTGEVLSPNVNEEITQQVSEVKAEVIKEVDNTQSEQVEQAPSLPDAQAEEIQPEPDAVASEEPSIFDIGSLTGKSKQELVDILEGLVEKTVDAVKTEIGFVKSAFFAAHNDEIARAKEQFVADGNDEADFVPAVDPLEIKFKDLLNELKEKRAAYIAQQEAIKLSNLEKKQSIIQEIKAISDDTDNVNKQINKVRQLQQDFKAIGDIPTTKEASRIYKDYQDAIENFYDKVKINKELRDYDFKKNLEIKQQLCAEAEALDDESNVIDAFKKLQKLHDTWRETGPVAKELREEIWLRFKNASAVINKKYQAFFEERKESEKENTEAKTALCEKIEAISTDNLKTYAAWEEATNQIKALQDDWRKLGFATRKLNNELFARFRKSCDEFFKQKTEFFKAMKEDLATNLAKKNELVAKAEALKESTDWKKATDEFIALQKEWKTIGPVVKKHSEAVWKKFVSACDYFFERKKAQTTNVHVVEHDNLKAKKEVINQLKALVEAEETEETPKAIRELMTKWQSIGHVPFKEKDKIYAEYRALVDKAYDSFNMRGSKVAVADFEASISDTPADKVYHEREKLVRSYEQKCNELKLYENNMGFFSAKSKSGNTIVKEMERKIERIKEDIATLEQKIKIIDEKI